MPSCTSHCRRTGLSMTSLSSIVDRSIVSKIDLINVSLLSDFKLYSTLRFVFCLPALFFCFSGDSPSLIRCSLKATQDSIGTPELYVGYRMTTGSIRCLNGTSSTCSYTGIECWPSARLIGRPQHPT